MNNTSDRLKDHYLILGNNIAQYRKRKNMTQEELAHEVGISRTHLSNIEAKNIVKPVSLEVVFKIADALDTEPEALFKKN